MSGVSLFPRGKETSTQGGDEGSAAPRSRSDFLFRTSSKTDSKKKDATSKKSSSKSGRSSSPSQSKTTKHRSVASMAADSIPRKADDLTAKVRNARLYYFFVNLLIIPRFLCLRNLIFCVRGL